MVVEAKAWKGRFFDILSVYPPPRNSHWRWMFRSGFPTKNGIILVVTGILGGGVLPRYIVAISLDQFPGLLCISVNMQQIVWDLGQLIKNYWEKNLGHTSNLMILEKYKPTKTSNQEMHPPPFFFCLGLKAASLSLASNCQKKSWGTNHGRCQRSKIYKEKKLQEIPQWNHEKQWD